MRTKDAFAGTLVSTGNAISHLNFTIWNLFLTIWAADRAPKEIYDILAFFTLMHGVITGLMIWHSLVSSKAVKMTLLFFSSLFYQAGIFYGLSLYLGYFFELEI